MMMGVMMVTLAVIAAGAAAVGAGAAVHAAQQPPGLPDVLQPPLLPPC